MEQLSLQTQKEQAAADARLKKLLEEKRCTDSGNQTLSENIKTKDEIIKKLTKENLLINSKVTQLQ